MKECNTTYQHTKLDSICPSFFGKGSMKMLLSASGTWTCWSTGSLKRLNRWCSCLIIALFVVLSASVQAQNFRNNGVYKGSGLFRVQNQATGLPDTVTGTFEYFGKDTQRVAAKNFEHLLLTGSGSLKQTLSDINIINSVAVADGVNFQVVSSTMTLEKITGRITSENGLISGRVKKTVDFSAQSDSSDFGGIGLSIRSNGSVLGTTDVVRISGSSVTSSNGNKSVKRWYEIHPRFTNGLSGNLYFRYAKDELAGNDSLLLELWRSPDSGATWRRQHTVLNGKTLERIGKNIHGLWTASASNNLIGRQNYEFDPDVISAAGADSLKGKIKKPLDSLFIALITDVYGNRISGAIVHFRIIAPLNALGQSLSNTTATTDDSGRVSTRLTLGDRKGRYQVIAEVESFPSTQYIFNGYADPGATALATISSPFPDTIKTILAPFVIESRDADSLAIADVSVQFSIVKFPAGATQQAIVQSDTTTDFTGRARARLRLGEKSGEYIITAHSREIDGVVDTFRVIALHGIPTLAWKDTVVRQDTIGKLIPQFTYTVTDSDTNAVSGRTVRFVLLRPDSTIIDSAFVLTDSIGQAKVATFRYGNTIGIYRVSAQDMNLAGSERFFTCIAVRGAARNLAQYSGDLQVGQIGDQLLPFVVRVTDAGGNFVPNAIVNFNIMSHADTLTKYDSLTASVDTTDLTGQASTTLTLGDRSGRYTVKASIAGVKDTIFSAYAIMIYADVNHDNYRNIGDLTSMIDHAIGRTILQGYDFSKADIYPKRSNGLLGDGLVDIRDIQVCLDSLLKAGWDPTRDWLNNPLPLLLKQEGRSFLAGTNAPIPLSLTDSCFIQTTHIGSRFWLKNVESVKGLQAVLYLKNPLVLDTADIIFPRAKMMTAQVKSVGKEVSIILWNYSNTPIEPGDSTIFRLPIQLTDNNLDSVKVMVSTGVNNAVSMVGAKQIDIRNMIPRDWMLYQNYPNPFNPSTTIEFDVPEITGKIPRVAVQIFNVLGQKVRTIERGIHDVGRYSVRWDGISENGVRVASGVYFYRLLAGDYTSTKKMVMIK
jgi:hypothetical protein